MDAISKEDFDYHDHIFNLVKNVTIQNTYQIVLSNHLVSKNQKLILSYNISTWLISYLRNLFQYIYWFLQTNFNYPQYLLERKYKTVKVFQMIQKLLISLYIKN